MSLRSGQARLKKLSKQLSGDGALSLDDREFLAKALSDISVGVDPEQALGVKAKRGERKGKPAQDMKVRQQFVNAWLATAIAPESEGGLGLSLREAAALIKAKLKDLPSEDTIRRYWNNVKDTQRRDFKIDTD
jgi:hypothetical protein